ncbi:MAG: cytochrome c-type biogenesis CcmF C-terminal domain-containing protein [Anaerolineales bacterium]|jgi:cytochrome c-type biogenesis protein CcmF
MVDTLVNFGLGALVLALLVSVYGIIASLYGQSIKERAWIDSGRNAMMLTFPLITVAASMIIILLVQNHFEVSYVSQVTSRSMPAYLKITALWGGQPGSLVFWSWLMSIFATAIALRDWTRDREFLPWVTVVVLVTLAFFLFLAIFFENPFARLWLMPTGDIVEKLFRPAGASIFTPADGSGLNPLLRHPGMIIHPPMQYLGFVSFVIPYAFAMAALITGRTDSRWIHITRKWTLWAWLFLSMGLVLGMRWAYDVLGWGGYWGWDPVENAALMPWLTATPFLHSVMIQEKRGMLKRWNMFLVILTYDLMIFGTFLVRSGVLSSVHSFAQSAIGPLFFAFIALTFIASIYLLSRRWGELHTDTQMTSWFSREGFFLINNLLFIGILVVVFWGVIFPILTEALGFVGDLIPSLRSTFTGQKVTVGPSYYERATGPLWGGLLLLMGICPLTAWRISTMKSLGRNIWKPTAVSFVVPIALVATGMQNWIAIFAFWITALVAATTLYEFYKGASARRRRSGKSFLVELWLLIGRNRRRYGGYLIHFGVVLMALGVIGIEMFQTETQATVNKGEQITLGDYSITYDDLAEFDTNDNRNVARAVVSVYHKGEKVDELYPRRDYFYESRQPMTIPGLRSTMEDDFYVILVDWQPISTQRATFKLYHNPLVNWLWIGAFVLIAGTMVAAWPEKETEELRALTREARVVAGD